MFLDEQSALARGRHWSGNKENFGVLSCEHVYGHEGDKMPEYIVLDGQQRLTAMYYAFLAPPVPLPRGTVQNNFP